MTDCRTASMRGREWHGNVHNGITSPRPGWGHCSTWGWESRRCNAIPDRRDARFGIVGIAWPGPHHDLDLRHGSGAAGRRRHKKTIAVCRSPDAGYRDLCHPGGRECQYNPVRCVARQCVAALRVGSSRSWQNKRGRLSLSDAVVRCDTSYITRAWY